MLARLLRTERELAQVRMNARREDTRRKIELGGLVVKAGLDQESSAVILGALRLATKALSGSSADTNRARFEVAGDAAFKENDDAVA